MMKNRILVLLSFCVLVCRPALAQEFEYEGIKYSCLTDTTAQVDSAPIDDGFVLIPEGSFLMGSPETEV